MAKTQEHGSVNHGWIIQINAAIGKGTEDTENRNEYLDYLDESSGICSSAQL